MDCKNTAEHSLFRIGHSRIHGRGLFAARTLFEGQFIGIYEGPVVEQDGIHVLWVEDRPDGGWVGYLGQNELRFMNHADIPNAEMDGLECYALQEIPVGHEITIDYGWNDS